MIGYYASSLAVDREYSGLPVVQAGLSQSEPQSSHLSSGLAVALCSYIPEASDYVHLDQFTIGLSLNFKSQ